jgi:murein DD-endopeptidase MepM/ murein hydrolase activator NlpD
MKVFIIFSVVFAAFFITGCSQLKSALSSEKIYHWRQGDSLQEVAKHFGDSVLEIRRRNHIYEPEDLFVGFPLVVRSRLQSVKKTTPTNSKINFGFPSPGMITSKYGPRKGKFHYGVDFGANNGKQVFSSADGVIRRVGSRTGYGNTIEVLHQKNIITLYAHLEKTLVRKGQRVRKNEQIAVMGNTGRSTGVHLHFEIIINGTNIDPLRLLK